MDEEDKKPTAAELVANQRRESVFTLGQLVVQEQRLTKALDDVRAKIAQAHDDVIALDKAAGLVG